MIRFVTDIRWNARGLFNRDLAREKSAMKSFATALCFAVATWMAAALMLIIYSREVAEFLVGRL